MKEFKMIIGIFLLAILSHPCFGEIDVGELSKDEAKELGIELRAKPGGPKHAWIELEFKLEGKLSKFQYVSLEIPDGDQLGLGWTPLKDKRTSSGSVIVRLMGSRKFLENVTLRIVHGDGDFGGSGLDVRLKDFVDFEKLLPKSKPSNGSEGESGIHGTPDAGKAPASRMQFRLVVEQGESTP